ncbi:MAG: prepilin peptidase [Opitutales bacterium]|nr:prepilin peptidase [Opitutales bacterium]
MIYGLLFIIGACIGSFLGVCIDRIPRKKSFIYGCSRCICGKQIPWYYNIPIFSWLILHGRSKCCDHPIPLKLLLIEVITACLFPLLWALKPQFSDFIIYATLISFLLVAAFIDFETMLIPDKLPLTLGIIGIVASIMYPQMHHTNDSSLSLQCSLLGLLLGSGILFWIGIIGEIIFKKEAIGIGDVQLVGAIGTFCGISGCLAAIFGGSLVGTAIFLPIILKKRLNFQKKSSKRNKTSSTFIPFLAIGTILFILFGDMLPQFF